MPLSGSQALYGSDQVKAAQWAVDDINAKGGVNGKKIEMIVLDTQADPQVAINAVNRLVSVEKVPVFITAWSSVVRAVAPIANDNKVVELSIGANSPDIAKLGDYVYTTFPLADVDVSAVARYAVQKIGAKKAAVVYINNDTGIVAAQVYRDSFTKAGGEVVAYEAYDPKATDFTGAILKVRAAQARHDPLAWAHRRHATSAGADAPTRSQPAGVIIFGDLQSQGDRTARQGGRGHHRHLACAGRDATSLLLARMSHAGRKRLAASRMDCPTRNTCMTRRI